MNKRNYKIISLACLIISILVWVPNIVFQVASPLWIITFVLGIIGAVFAALGKNYWLMLGNIIMFFSFFILMAIGYSMNA